MKKKPPADHRPQAYKSEHYIPTEEEAQELSSDFRFLSDFDLRRRLEYAYMSEESIRHYGQTEPSISDVRGMLNTLNECCTDLQELVTKLGPVERRLLMDSMLETRKSSITELERDLRNLKLASAVALKTIEGEKSNRSKNKHIWNFIYHLADIWQHGTGEQPTTGYADEFNPGRYVGDFYQFIVRCAALGNVTLSNGDPGGTIVRVLKEWRTKQNTGGESL
jgi:hypothetical protein